MSKTGWVATATTGITLALIITLQQMGFFDPKLTPDQKVDVKINAIGKMSVYGDTNSTADSAYIEMISDMYANAEEDGTKLPFWGWGQWVHSFRPGRVVVTTYIAPGTTIVAGPYSYPDTHYAKGYQRITGIGLYDKEEKTYSWIPFPVPFDTIQFEQDTIYRVFDVTGSGGE